MGKRIQLFIKTDKGLRGYRHIWKHGTAPIERLYQLHQHHQRMLVTNYAKMFEGQEERMIRMMAATDFETGTELHLVPLGEDELQNPTGEFMDDVDGILYIDMTGRKFEYAFVRFTDFKLENAFDYLLDYMLEVKGEKRKANIAMLLRTVAHIPVMNPEDIKKSYPELHWEMLNFERSTQMPDTKKRIKEWKEEGRLEPSIGYNYIKNRFYYRQTTSADKFENGTIELKALKELDDVPLDFYALQRTHFYMDREGVVWLRSENSFIQRYLVFLTRRIEDEYAALELNLVTQELV